MAYKSLSFLEEMSLDGREMSSINHLLVLSLKKGSPPPPPPKKKSFIIKSNIIVVFSFIDDFRLGFIALI